MRRLPLRVAGLESAAAGERDSATSTSAALLDVYTVAAADTDHGFGVAGSTEKRLDAAIIVASAFRPAQQLGLAIETVGLVESSMIQASEHEEVAVTSGHAGRGAPALRTPADSAETAMSDVRICSRATGECQGFALSVDKAALLTRGHDAAGHAGAV